MQGGGKMSHGMRERSRGGGGSGGGGQAGRHLNMDMNIQQARGEGGVASAAGGNLAWNGAVAVRSARGCGWRCRCAGADAGRAQTAVPIATAVRWCGGEGEGVWCVAGDCAGQGSDEREQWYVRVVRSKAEEQRALVLSGA